MTPSVRLIRHAESTANAGLPSKSPASTPLSELGRQQAVAIRIPEPTLIVVSGYIRTSQTAEPTIARYPHVPVEVWPVEEFTFLNPAKYVNTTQEQRTPAVLAYLARNDPEYRDGGAAESFYDLLSRASETLDRLKLERYKGAAVFSHARFIQALRWIEEGRAGTPRDFLSWVDDHPVPNASITSLCRRLVPRGWILGPPELTRT